MSRKLIFHGPVQIHTRAALGETMSFPACSAGVSEGGTRENGRSSASKSASDDWLLGMAIEAYCLWVVVGKTGCEKTAAEGDGDGKVRVGRLRGATAPADSGGWLFNAGKVLLHRDAKDNKFKFRVLSIVG